MERRVDVINIWFWARDDPSVPVGVANGNSEVITDNWVSAFSIKNVVEF